jgi:hypothetical protein
LRYVVKLIHLPSLPKKPPPSAIKLCIKKAVKKKADGFMHRLGIDQCEIDYTMPVLI